MGRASPGPAWPRTPAVRLAIDLAALPALATLEVEPALVVRLVDRLAGRERHRARGLRAHAPGAGGVRAPGPPGARRGLLGGRRRAGAGAAAGAGRARMPPRARWVSSSSSSPGPSAAGPGSSSRPPRCARSATEAELAGEPAPPARLDPPRHRLAPPGRAGGAGARRRGPGPGPRRRARGAGLARRATGRRAASSPDGFPLRGDRACRHARRRSRSRSRSSCAGWSSRSPSWPGSPPGPSCRSASIAAGR